MMSIAFKRENILLHTALITLLLLSSSFGDEDDDAKQRQNIVQNEAGKNPPKMEGKDTSVDNNSGGSELEAAKDASQPKMVESNGSDVSGKVKVEGDDVSGKVKVDDVSEKGKVNESGKVILLFHPINTKSHRNQQNAIAEVSQQHRSLNTLRKLCKQFII